MKILHVTTNYPSERHPAFGVFVQTQLESLAGRKGETDVVCEPFFLDGRGSVGRYFVAWLRLIGHLLTHRYDILHAHHALSGLLLCLSGAPLFSRTVLSYQNSPSREWGRSIFFLLYPFFRRIVLKAADPAYDGFAKVRVIPNGCSQERFKPMDKAVCRRTLGLDADARYVLFVDANPRRAKRRAGEQKREDRFDAVLERVRERLSADSLPLQGTASPVLSLKLREVPPEKMPLYYNAADLYLLTSDFEGSPNAVKECLLCNTPVVATPVGDLPFLGGRVPGCCVCSGFSEDLLADSVLEVLAGDAPDDLSPRSSSTPDDLSSRDALLALGYGLDCTASRLLNLYQELL